MPSTSNEKTKIQGDDQKMTNRKNNIVSLNPVYGKDMSFDEFSQQLNIQLLTHPFKNSHFIEVKKGFERLNGNYSLVWTRIQIKIFLVYAFAAVLCCL